MDTVVVKKPFVQRGEDAPEPQQTLLLLNHKLAHPNVIRLYAADCYNRADRNTASKP